MDRARSLIVILIHRRTRRLGIQVLVLLLMGCLPAYAMSGPPVARVRHLLHDVWQTGEDIDLAWLPDQHVWPIKVDPSQIDQIPANLCVNARDAIAGVGTVTIETATVAFDEAYCANHTGFAPGEYVRLAAKVREALERDRGKVS